MKAKFSYHIFFGFCCVCFFCQNAFCQNTQLDSANTYYKTERGPYWTKAQLDSFLRSRNNSRYKLVARRTSFVKRNDSLIYFVNLRMDPVAVDNLNRPWEGQALPQFAFRDMANNLINSKNLIGKPVVLNIWFTTCGPCIEEIPDLNRLRNEYENSGAVFLAITFDKKSAVINFLKRHPFNFTIIPEAKWYCDQVTGLYPLTFFVDKNGIIRYAEHVLPFSFDTLKDDLKAVLKNNF